MARRSYSRSYSRPRREPIRSDRGAYKHRSSKSPPSRDRGYKGGPNTLNSENQVYVARFGRRTTEYDLRKAFEVYGYIEKIDLKEGRGFGFIVSKLEITLEIPGEYYFLIEFIYLTLFYSTSRTGEMQRMP